MIKGYMLELGYTEDEIDIIIKSYPLSECTNGTVIKYIKQIYNKDNILIDDIKELQTNENTEVEAKNFAKKQKIMLMIYIGIVVSMVASIMIAGIFAG